MGFEVVSVAIVSVSEVKFLLALFWQADIIPTNTGTNTKSFFSQFIFVEFKGQMYQYTWHQHATSYFDGAVLQSLRWCELVARTSR
ncbi:hypothetical protein GCM10027443_01790 [Pontibacter brevis]